MLVRPRRPSQLAELGRPAAVVATGAVGYLDAAEDDRRRWVAGFRALLDGLDAPLQVLIEFAPGKQELKHEPLPGEALDARGRRQVDVDFAQAMRESKPAVQREVSL